MAEKTVENPLPKEKIRAVYDLYHFLGLEKYFLGNSLKVKKYITLATRGIKIGEYDSYVRNQLTGDFILEGTEKKVTDSKMADSIEKQVRNGGLLLPFLDVAANIGRKIHIRGEENRDLYSAVALNIVKGNLVEAVLEGRGSCLDFAVTMKLLAENFYRDTQVDIIHYSLKSVGTGKNDDGHYGLHVKLPGEKTDYYQPEWLVMYGGMRVPINILEEEKNKSGTLNTFLEDKLDKRDSTRSVAAAFKQIYKNWQRMDRGSIDSN